MLSLPDAVREQYDVSSLRHMIHAAAPCPIDVKHKMIAWWGNAVDEYYAASEGGGTVVTAEEWLQKTRHGRQGMADFGDRHLRRRRQRRRRAQVIGTVYMAMRPGVDFEYHGDKEKTEEPDRQVLHRRRRRRTRRGRLPVPP